MLFDQIRRLATRLARAQGACGADQSGTAARTPSIFEIDPMWHGDHWQNLLCSPMDARHYVMEDWSTSIADEYSDIDSVAPAH